MNGMGDEQTELIMAERAFLSSVISDPDSLGEIDSLKIEPVNFLEYRNRTVFQHFLKLRSTGINPDYITLSESLNTSGELERIGGQSFLLSIFDEYASAANIKNYAEIIKKKSDKEKESVKNTNDKRYFKR